MTSSTVLGFDEIDRTRAALVGGKGAHLAELSRIDGIRVPAGFCVTTDAFQRTLANVPSIGTLLGRLSALEVGDREAIRALSAEIRRTIEEVAVPDDIAAEIAGAIEHLGENDAYAVRSSATAEDLPTTSFAGQHDSYLNVSGLAEIVRHVSRCWASLFTERAVVYRLRNGVDHRGLRMAVVVQRMVVADASGILFTADPVTGNRKVVSIDAGFGLGEALVSGLVTPDVFTVQDGRLASRQIAATSPALTDDQALMLAKLGRRIEAHFARPQDIEWCRVGDDFHIVQSRPITTLFPIPEAADDGNHVYVSVGHQQMMTDAMKPLGLSFWQLTTPRPMAEAGGRLFVDVTQPLSSPASRDALLAALGKSDPLIRDALQSVLDRGDFVTAVPDSGPAWTAPGGGSASIETDPAIVAELMARTQSSLATAAREIRSKSGSELLDFILSDLQEMRRAQFEPRSLQVIMAGMEAMWWLNEHLATWLGERNAADALVQSVPDNITSEMGLALLDVADVIRPHPEVVKYLQDAGDESFLDGLGSVAGGHDAREAIEGWLASYGMRGPGEIDITRPRWRERPSMLLPLILGNVRNEEHGAHARRFALGRETALQKEREILARLRSLPEGERKAAETRRTIDRMRTFSGYREYPKYGMVSRYFIYKQALLEEADRLVRTGVIDRKDDIYYLRFQELQDVVREQVVDRHLIQQRREEYASYRSLVPPRVLTSDGEGVSGSYRRDDVPDGALAGLAVSAGVVEGRARIVLDAAEARLEPGDILVTTCTDPSWTPLFVAIVGLVTEVGGLMTHGAVIAREYGIPAVVGVAGATRVIPDGHRIRVHGTSGWVELLD